MSPQNRIKMRKIDVLAVVLLLVLSGCRLKRPDDVLSPKKMEQFLYDYHMAQAIIQDLPKEDTTHTYWLKECLKSRTITTPNAGQTVTQQNSHCW